MISIQKAVSDAMRINRRARTYEMIKMWGPCTGNRILSGMFEHYSYLYPKHSGAVRSTGRDIEALEMEGLITRLPSGSDIVYEVVA